MEYYDILSSTLIHEELSGLLIFSFSVMIHYRLYKNYFSNGKNVFSFHSSVNNEYKDTLSKLFQVTNNPSRHRNDKLLSIDDIFLDRKKFFQSVFLSSFQNRNCPRVIHVAGTKGKGSTVEYIASGLRANNNRVGVFTSPHLHTARERIKINKQLISKEDIVRLGCEALSVLESKSWTVFFDLFMYMAIRYFGEQNVDYIILETGIGGKYDSTNFLDNPVACVITNISLDHQAILGETLDLIALQKAGIMKRNCPVFTFAEQNEIVMKVFSSESERIGSILNIVPNDVKLENASYHNNIDKFFDVQTQNFLLAKAVLSHLNVNNIDINSFYWPCRMEKISLNNIDIILDGCHNGYSVHEFMKSLKMKYHDKRVVLLFGAGYEKCVKDMIKPINDFADLVIMVQSKHFKSIPEIELMDMFVKFTASEKKRYPLILRDNLVADEFSDFRGPYNRKEFGTIDDRLRWAIDHFNRRFVSLIDEMIELYFLYIEMKMSPLGYAVPYLLPLKLEKPYLGNI